MPGDKSVSHRVLMMASIAEGMTRISNLSSGRDVRSTWECLSQLGIDIEKEGETVLVHGRGLRGFSPPGNELDVGNSGTTMRLLSGILAAQPFESVLTGDDSIRKRPMNRILNPLRQMGANIDSTTGGTAPLRINGRKLVSVDYTTPVPSAQVKSCVLLAGLYASGKTSVKEKSLSRDHTERMLSCFGVNIERNDLEVSITGPAKLRATTIDVPGDISSAAFFIIAGSLVKDSELILPNVGINPSRLGIIEILKAMGGRIRMEDVHLKNEEPRADIIVESSRLKKYDIDGSLIPRVIDEIPILAVAAARAEGETVIRGARELRAKETDRIEAVAQNLKTMGVEFRVLDDGFVIQGPQQLKGGVVESHGDHRIAMAFSIAGLTAEGETIIKGSECADISFPGFFDALESIRDD